MYTFVSAGPYAGACAASCMESIHGTRNGAQRWEGFLNAAKEGPLLKC